MIEDVTTSLLAQSGIELWVDLGILLFGFALALLIHRRSSWTLRRIPYFVAVTGLFFLHSVFLTVSLIFSDVIQPSGLWLFIVTVLFAQMVFGYLYGVISLARSLDSYGNGHMAWVAFVPIAFLVLWFKAPLNNKKPISAARMVGNAAAVFLGLAFFALRAINDPFNEAAFEYMIDHTEANADLSAAARLAKAQSQTLSQAQAPTRLPALRNEVIQIKGLHNGMELNQALLAIYRRGGTCSSSESRDDFSNKTVVWTSCEIHDETRQDDWNKTDIYLSSDRTRSGLVLTHIHFQCEYINTCGMSFNEITKAPRSAGVLSRNSDDRNIRINDNGNITLPIIGTDEPIFN
ncbi:hypothetical protein [Marivita sp. GX14005]|uniref:hypothetical protein n=1 Tax=Marivita sp. GX14005 TaxID=2942276 RepID=UPI002019ADB4|nr:hypothetical protein [Marivita sp. GX14005]MCL3882307.1 hypothetical protein [Marivita sp. GX14005]